MIFCCEKFKGYFTINSTNEGERYPNVVIVTHYDNHIKREVYRFLIVCGFRNDNPPILNIIYCPFCGGKLSNFYSYKAFVNGIWDDFFE